MLFSVDINQLKTSKKLLEILFLERKDPPSRPEDFVGEADYLVGQFLLALLSGSREIMAEQIETLCSLVPEPLSRIVRTRWYAVVAYLRHEFGQAMSLLMDAYKQADKANAEQWLIRDIVLDLRNIEHIKATRSTHDLPLGPSEWQAGLQRLEKWRGLPWVDASRASALEYLSDEMFTTATTPPEAVRIGGNLPRALESFAEAFIGAISVGSLTFMSMLRLQLATVLSNYARLYHSSELAVQAVKLFIIAESGDKLRRMLQADWETLYPYVAYDPVSLIELATQRASFEENRAVKCVLIEELGSYVPDAYLDSVHVFLEEALDGLFSFNNKLDVKRSALGALKTTINRLSIERMLQKLLPLLEAHPLVVEEVLKVLQRIEWEKVSSCTAMGAAEQVYSRRDNALTPDATYHMLLRIKEAHPTVAAEWDERVYEEWKTKPATPALTYLCGGQGVPNAEHRKAISSWLVGQIRHSNAGYVEGSSISTGGLPEAQLLAYNVAYTPSPEWGPFLTALTEVLKNPHQTAWNKQDALNGLILVARAHRMAKNEFLATLGDILEQPGKIVTARADPLFGAFQEAVELKAHELVVILGIVSSPETITTRAIELSLHPSPKVRWTAIELIRTVLEECPAYEESRLLEFLLLKTSDSWPRIRGEAIVLLSRIAERPEWVDLCVRRMKALLRDSHPYVRSSVLYAANERLKMGDIRDEWISLLRTGLDDPHYKVRDQAKRYLEVPDG